MAFIKNPAVVLAFMALFGLDTMAAPQVGKSLTSDLADYTIVPISTMSMTSLVTVLPTAPASTSTVVLEQPEVEVVTTSRTIFVPAKSSKTPSSSPVASTVTVTAASALPTSGMNFAYVPIVNPVNTTEIGSTCRQENKEEKGRDVEIRSCVARNNMLDYCRPGEWACQRYILQKAKECYRKNYSDCKKDGFYSALENAEKQANALAKLVNKSYVPKGKGNKKVYPSF